MNNFGSQNTDHAIFMHIFYSLLIHTIAVSSMLVLPLYSSGTVAEQDGWYFIHLENEETVQAKTRLAKVSNPVAERPASKAAEKPVAKKEETPLVEREQAKSPEMKSAAKEKATDKADASLKKTATAAAKPNEEFAKPPAVQDVSGPSAPKGDERPATSDADKKPAVTASVLPIEEPIKSLHEIKSPLPTEETSPPTPDAKESGIALMQTEPKGDVIAKILSAPDQSAFNKVLSPKPKEEKNTTVVANGDKKPLPDLPVEEKIPEPEENLQKSLKPAEPEAVVAKIDRQEESFSATSHEKASKSNQMYRLSLPRAASKIALRSSIPAIDSKSDLLNQNMKRANDNYHKKEMIEAEEKKKTETEKKIFKAIPVMNKPVLEDIKIEVDLEGDEMPFVSMGFVKKQHAEPHQIENIREEAVNCSVDTKMKALNMSGIKHVYSVLTADKAIYAFVIENKGQETYKADILFRIYEGQDKERIKEYRNVILESGVVLKYKFILPYMVFWDDDVFSLVMEDSIYLTKVHKELGLIWKEMKEKKAVH